jgi:hypothetical protein
MDDDFVLTAANVVFSRTNPDNFCKKTFRLKNFQPGWCVVKPVCVSAFFVKIVKSRQIGQKFLEIYFLFPIFVPSFHF